ncbi:hypothetical protein BD289DRAFT_283168 [Coniella lustricola]|uniref:Uncharacterized protein n=1 Tax=Coniella lustricola TaxID=2025994 RepID=A0A2T3AJV2_9PEZI|nr:hypothetical protein BD289DRAFT_283168 [Coniella lustricola]
MEVSVIAPMAFTVRPRPRFLKRLGFGRQSKDRSRGTSWIVRVSEMDWRNTLGPKMLHQSASGCCLRASRRAVDHSLAMRFLVCHFWHRYMGTYTYVCTYTCIYTCIYICTCTCVHIHAHHGTDIDISASWGYTRRAASHSDSMLYEPPCHHCERLRTAG